MADEELLDLEDSTPEDQEKINKVEKRIKGLSEKVKTTAEERDEANAKAEKAEADRQAALKDVDFYKNFSTVNSKYSGAAEFQDKIKEKVMAGYDLEDATVAVLNKEGKFVPPTAPPPPRESPTGGSAPNTFKAGGEKPVGDMNLDEKRAALLEAEKRGDLGLN